MVVRTLVSEHDYLHTAYDGPEPDYVDGVLIERAMPNLAHSSVQANLMDSLRDMKAGLHRFPELRIKVAPRRYRVGDLVIYREKPAKLVPDEPPFIVAEIVSPDDTYEDIMAKLEDYAELGVPHIWLINPSRHSIHVFKEGDLKRVPAFELPELQASINAEQILH